MELLIKVTVIKVKLESSNAIGVAIGINMPIALIDNIKFQSCT